MLIEIATFEVNPTPEELAELFWNMDSSMQARFFEYLDQLDHAGFVHQFRHIYRDASPEGRSIMRAIGEAFRSGER